MNNIFKKILIVTIVFFQFSFFYGETSKLIGNYIKIEVNNQNGRFLLFGRNEKEGDWIPLLFEDYPSTSYFRFFVNKKDISFGDHGYQRDFGTEVIDNKIIYYWQNKEVKINLIYQLISSGKMKYADTLLLTLKITNLSFKKLSINYFFCLDTYLGESSNTHFIYNNETINSEKEIKNFNQDFLFKTYHDKLQIGLNYILKQSNDYPVPDRLYFANWKRVNEKIGEYQVVQYRSFDLTPYSLNDSAIFIEYKNQDYDLKQSKEYQFILSMNNEVKIETKEMVINNDNKIKENNITKTEKTDEKNINKNVYLYNNMSLLNMNLKDLLELLDSINKKLEEGKILKEEDIILTNKILEEVKNRRNLE